MRINVFGAGAWGTALACVWSQAGHTVTLLARDAVTAATLQAERRNQRYLSDVAFPKTLAISSVDIAPDACDQCDLAVIATPVVGLRACLAWIPSGTPLLWLCKGFEATIANEAAPMLPHAVVAQRRGSTALSGALVGPSFAAEVARGLPVALTLASEDPRLLAFSSQLHSATMRIYTTDDVLGAELGGALKNVIAIATGIADGLGLGLNARAALITRGLAEMSRMGVALGARPETFMGLTGLGDLILTCTGALSRNRSVGLRLASGAALNAVLRELGHVAEGVPAAQAARRLARLHGIEMPIVQAVASVLFDGVAPALAVQTLLSRPQRGEGD